MCLTRFWPTVHPFKESTRLRTANALGARVHLLILHGSLQPHGPVQLLVPPNPNPFLHCHVVYKPPPASTQLPSQTLAPPLPSTSLPARQIGARPERPLRHSLVHSHVLMVGTPPSSSLGPPHRSWPTPVPPDSPKSAPAPSPATSPPRTKQRRSLCC